MSQREVNRILSGVPAADGDGVQLTRIIGHHGLSELDPFLLLDHFGSDKPQDYIGGFPPHPHRGFETVTYMLAGKMRHEDSAGHSGVIEAGGVQWMTAGRGIIHSEMPEQECGLLSGFQLWVNLPAKHKMITPRYQERSANEIPVESLEYGKVIVIAGKTDQGTKGVIENHFVEPLYLDVHLRSGGQFSQTIPSTSNAFIYVYQGRVTVGEQKSIVKQNELAILGAGDRALFSTDEESRFILIAGKPLNEPIVRAGPFVMNSEAEIVKAFTDYRSGKFAS